MSNKLALLAAVALLPAPAQAATVVNAVKVVVTSHVNDYLQVAELQAFTFGGTNVALQTNGGVASAPNVCDPVSQPGRANDGDFPAAFPYIYCSGYAGPGNHLKIDFSGPFDLASLTIYGRAAGAWHYRDLYDVTIFDKDGGSQTFVLDARTAEFATVTFDRPKGGVPEPTSWAMMLAGFGMTGGMLRREQRAAAA